MIRMIIVNGDEERPPIKQSLESYHENFNFKEKNEEKNFQHLIVPLLHCTGHSLLKLCNSF